MNNQSFRTAVIGVLLVLFTACSAVADPAAQADATYRQFVTAIQEQDRQAVIDTLAPELRQYPQAIDSALRQGPSLRIWMLNNGDEVAVDTIDIGDLQTIGSTQIGVVKAQFTGEQEGRAIANERCLTITLAETEAGWRVVDWAMDACAAEPESE